MLSGGFGFSPSSALADPANGARPPLVAVGHRALQRPPDHRWVPALVGDDIRLPELLPSLLPGMTSPLPGLGRITHDTPWPTRFRETARNKPKRPMETPGKSVQILSPRPTNLSGAPGIAGKCSRVIPACLPETWSSRRLSNKLKPSDFSAQCSPWRTTIAVPGGSWWSVGHPSHKLGTQTLVSHGVNKSVAKPMLSPERDLQLGAVALQVTSPLRGKYGTPRRGWNNQIQRPRVATKDLTPSSMEPPR